MSSHSKVFHIKLLVFAIVLLLACKESSETSPSEEAPAAGFADITQVNTQQSSTNFSFSVTISSPDEGCEQYADWWEVVSENGDLIYRRILAHSHVNEQPFTRSGSPVEVSATQQVWIRAHMNNTGYGGKAFFGSADSGFNEKDFPENFADDLDKESPLPNGCAF